MSEVPCGSCRLCCVGTTVVLAPGEVGFFKNRPHPTDPYRRAVAVDEKGNCVYLTPTGCECHKLNPVACSRMDCRELAASLTYEQAKAEGLLPAWQRGKEITKK